MAVGKYWTKFSDEKTNVASHLSLCWGTSPKDVGAYALINKQSRTAGYDLWSIVSLLECQNGAKCYTEPISILGGFQYALNFLLE